MCCGDRGREERKLIQNPLYMMGAAVHSGRSEIKKKTKIIGSSETVFDILKTTKSSSLCNTAPLGLPTVREAVIPRPVTSDSISTNSTQRLPLV